MSGLFLEESSLSCFLVVFCFMELISGLCRRIRKISWRLSTSLALILFSSQTSFAQPGNLVESHISGGSGNDFGDSSLTIGFENVLWGRETNGAHSFGHERHGLHEMKFTYARRNISYPLAHLVARRRTVDEIPKRNVVRRGMDGNFGECVELHTLYASRPNSFHMQFNQSKCR